MCVILERHSVNTERQIKGEDLLKACYTMAIQSERV